MAETKDIEESQQGVEMRAFKLQDSSGKWVTCMVHGRHASNEHLVVNNEIVIFFGVAMAGKEGQAGQIWVYDDAHVIKTKANVRVSVGPRVQCLLP